MRSLRFEVACRWQALSYEVALRVQRSLRFDALGVRTVEKRKENSYSSLAPIKHLVSEYTRGVAA